MLDLLKNIIEKHVVSFFLGWYGSLFAYYVD